jgi:CRP/FNR family cyclic AMP-dependent transcriptional regulator
MTPLIVSNLPLFSTLPESLLEKVAQQSQIVEFSAGHELLKAGKKSNFLIIILNGTILLNEHAQDGRVIGVSFAGPHQVLAWLSMIDGKQIDQTIVSATPCQVFLCPVVLVQELIRINTDFAIQFLTLAASYIRQLEQARAMLSLPNAFHRVFVQINMLSAAANEGKTSLPKQQDIANSANTSRETVSRALQMLIKSGVLHKVGHQIVIKQAHNLKQLAIDGPDAMPLPEEPTRQ